MSLKKGDKVVVIATDRQLRDMHCSEQMQPGSEHIIKGLSGDDFFLDVEMGPYIRKEWVELADPYTDKDWV